MGSLKRRGKKNYISSTIGGKREGDATLDYAGGRSSLNIGGRFGRVQDTFLKYVDGVSRYRQRKGIEESLQPELQLQLKQQTKLDKWKEYYVYEHCKLGRLERKVKQTQLGYESYYHQYG